MKRSWPVILILLVAVSSLWIVSVLAVDWVKSDGELEVFESPSWVLEKDGSWTCYNSEGKEAVDSAVCMCAETPE